MNTSTRPIAEASDAATSERSSAERELVQAPTSGLIGTTAPTPRRRPAGRTIVVALVVLAAAVAAALATSSWPVPQQVVCVVFAAATATWMLSRLDDTLVALLAALALVVAGVMPSADLFASLGDSTVWLLIGACMLAAGLAASGIVERLAARLVGGARSVRGLAHRTTLALCMTAFAVPATSGRAALALPLFRVLGAALPTPTLQRGFSLLFPAVVLLSAFASILGAGAHVIAAELIHAATGVRISFLLWLACGVPVAFVTAHIAAEVVLSVVFSRADRRADVAPIVRAVAAAAPKGRMTAGEWRALGLLLTVVAGWLTEPFHSLPSAVVALIGAVVAVAPGIGVATPQAALTQVPWSLLLFLAATLAIGSAVIETGTADALADVLLTPLAAAAPVVALLAIIAFSAFAHLLIQSRSARSSVLVPIVLAVAPAAGLDPASAALASTAAAGFCLTLTSSAKPVAMFSDVDGVATFSRGQLAAFSLVLAPYVIGAVLVAAVFWWPLLGIPVT